MDSRCDFSPEDPLSTAQQGSSPNSTANPLGLTYLFGSLAIVLLWFQVIRLLDPAQARGEFPVQATILRSQVLKVRVHPGDFLLTFWVYDPQVEYTFEYKERTYQSRNVFYRHCRVYSKEEAEEIVAQFPPGMSVTAYCDRKGPGKTSVLTKAPPPDQWRLAKWAGVFLGLAVLIKLLARATGATGRRGGDTAGPGTGGMSAE